MNLLSNLALCGSLLLLNIGLSAQSVGISISDDPAATPHLSAMLDVKSTNKGMLVPRMDSTLRKNISSPAVGLLVFDTSTESFWYRDGSTWIELKASPWSNKNGPIIYTSDAQVGIGLNNPESALHVKGNVMAQESLLNTGDGEFFMKDVNGDTRIHFNKVYSNNETFFRIEVYVPDPNGEARVEFFGNTDAKTKRVEFLRGNGFNSERSAVIGVDQENSFFQASGGNMGVGTPDPDPNAILDVESTTKGVLFPRLSTSQRITLGNAGSRNGLLVFDKETKSYWYRVDNNWVELKSSAVVDEIAILNETSGTGAGSVPTGNTFYKRNLMDQGNNSPNISINNGFVTLKSGKYLVTASAPARGVERHFISLRKSNDELLLIGTSEIANDVTDIQTTSTLRGFVNVPDNTQYELKLMHWCENANADINALGQSREPYVSGWVNVYAQMMIQKIQ